MGKPWSTKEWKQKRGDLLKDAKCARCGSTEKLVIHHPQHIFKSPATLKQELYSKFYTQFSAIYRKTQKPKTPVRTGNHRHTSHYNWHPIKRIHKTAIDESNLEFQYTIPQFDSEDKLEFKNAYNDWLKSINAKEQVEKILKENDVRYKSLENTEIICSACHFATHRGMDLCPVCKKKYKKIQYKTCYDCLPKERKDTLERMKAQEAEFFERMDIEDD